MKPAKKKSKHRGLFFGFGGAIALAACFLLLDMLIGNDPPPAKGYKPVTLVDLGNFKVIEPDMLNMSIQSRGKPKPIPTPTATTFPDAIKALDGQELVIPGYMMPYDNDGNGGVLSFYLVRSILVCCFGVPPRLNEVVRCDAPPGHPCKYYYNVPIRVYGKLHVAEIKEYGQVQALYRLNVERIDVLKYPDKSLQLTNRIPPAQPVLP